MKRQKIILKHCPHFYKILDFEAKNIKQFFNDSLINPFVNFIKNEKYMETSRNI